MGGCSVDWQSHILSGCPVFNSWICHFFHMCGPLLTCMGFSFMCVGAPSHLYGLLFYVWALLPIVWLPISMTVLGGNTLGQGTKKRGKGKKPTWLIASWSCACFGLKGDPIIHYVNRISLKVSGRKNWHMFLNMHM